MNRRNLLAVGAASVVVSALRTPAEGSTNPTPPARDDGLNPPGIRTAGICMLPVVGGKYKVWTKKMGSGPVKVLLDAYQDGKLEHANFSKLAGELVQRIRAIKPHVVVKGGQYAREQVVGHDTCEVILAPMAAGLSTTSIIEKMK